MQTATASSDSVMYDDEIEMVASLLKSMSHPIRLKILCLLHDEEMSVGELRERVHTTHANVSQHLGILRSQGIITSRKDANFIYNSVTDIRVAKLIKTMHELYCPEGVH